MHSHVQPGSLRGNSAAEANAIRDSLRAQAMQNLSTPSPAAQQPLGANEVLVKNITGIQIERYELGFISNSPDNGKAGAEDTVAIPWADNRFQYAKQPVFRWARSIGTQLGGTWEQEWPTAGAVTLEPIAIGKVGRAVIAGPTPVQLWKSTGALTGAHDLPWVYRSGGGYPFAQKAPFGFRLLSGADEQGLGWINLSHTCWTCLAVVSTGGGGGGSAPRSGENPGGVANCKFIWANTNRKLRRYGTTAYFARLFRWHVTEANYTWKYSGTDEPVRASSIHGDRLAYVQLLGDGRWWIVNWDPFERGFTGNHPFPGNDTEPANGGEGEGEADPDPAGEGIGEEE